MILRTVDWDLRYNMRRKYGFAAGIVYAQPMDGDYEPACWNRTRVKLWAQRRFGNPATILRGEIHIPPSCEWFAGRTGEEYTIAFKNPKYRNLALLM